MGNMVQTLKDEGQEGHMGLRTNRVHVLCPQGWVSAFIRRVPFFTCLLLAISTKAIPSSDLPNFNGLPNFIQPGSLQMDNLAAIDGDMGADGLLFTADGAAKLSGLWNGALYSGQGTITHHPGAVPASVPEPKLLFFAGFAGLLVHSARRRVTRGNVGLTRKNQPGNLQSENSIKEKK